MATSTGPASSERPMSLPEPGRLSPLLGQLGFTRRDATAVLASLPRQDQQPELWDVLWDAHRRLVASIDAPGPVDLLPPGLQRFGPAGDLFVVYLMLSVLPHTLAWHRSKGIPEDVTWSTLSDLGRHADIFYRFNGRSGFDEAGWISLHFRCLLFQLGRLQFERWSFPADWPRLAEGAGPGAGALNIHIPESGPLRPAECDQSLAAALPFFDRHFPGHGYTAGVCRSWLLDDQLTRYLPGESNIIRFQRRFELLADGYVSNENILRFVFRTKSTDLGSLPQDTSLQRAVVEHIRNGGAWRSVSGWLRLNRTGE
jgi:hypothetical protein